MPSQPLSASRYCVHHGLLRDLGLSLLLALWAASAQAQLNGVALARQQRVQRAQPLAGFYEGALAGNYRVWLQLSTQDSVLTGQYYYVRNGRLLRLTGHVAPSGEVALRESAGPDTAATGGFVGHVLPDEKLVGSWHNAAGTVHLPFELTRVVGTDGLSNFVFKVLTGNFQVAFSHAELARFHPPQNRGRFGTMLIAARRNLS